MWKHSRVTEIIMKVMMKLSYPSGLTCGRWNYLLIDKINTHDIVSRINCYWKVIWRRCVGWRWIMWQIKISDGCIRMKRVIMISDGYVKRDRRSRLTRRWNVWLVWWCDLCSIRWKIVRGAGEKRKRRILINMKFKERRKHFMLPGYDMARDTKKFIDRIPACIPFVFDPIPQEITKTRTWFKFRMFMWLK